LPGEHCGRSVRRREPTAEAPRGHRDRGISTPFAVTHASLRAGEGGRAGGMPPDPPPSRAPDSFPNRGITRTSSHRLSRGRLSCPRNPSPLRPSSLYTALESSLLPPRSALAMAPAGVAHPPSEPQDSPRPPTRRRGRRAVCDTVSTHAIEELPGSVSAQKSVRAEFRGFWAGATAPT